MFEQLINFEPDAAPAEGLLALDEASPQDVVNAQSQTLSWLEDIGAPSVDDVDTELAKKKAREAFTQLATTAAPLDQKAALLALKTPEAVRHLTGMLTAYDWEFIEQAKELRGYAVAGILEETKNGKAEIRLKALALLGKITEVGLFTEKIEVTKKDMPDAELDARIKEKFERMRRINEVVAPAADVLDVTAKEKEPEATRADGVALIAKIMSPSETPETPPAAAE